MTVKNFKVGQGLDLDGLVLTNGSGELLVNGNAIAVDLTGYATETYVANALTPYATQVYVANALSSYATLAGTETLSNKTLASPTVTIGGDFSGTTKTGQQVNLYSSGGANYVEMGNALDWGSAFWSGPTGDGTLDTVTIVIVNGTQYTVIDKSDWGSMSLRFGVAETISGFETLEGATVEVGSGSPLITVSSTELAYLDGVNGTIATQSYVANAIANSTVDLAPAAGNYIDWNVNTEAFDLDFYTVANALAGDGLVYQNGQLAAKTGGIIDGNSTYIPVTKDGSGNLAIFDNAVTDRLAGNGLISAKSSGLYHFDIDYATVSTTLVNSYNIAQSNALPTYTTANVLAGTGLNVGYNNYYNSYSIDVDTNYIATVDHVANSISNLVGLAPTTLDTLQELSTALQDNPNVIANLQSIASGKQNALIEGFAIDIYGNTIAVDSAAIANAIAGSGITYSNGQLTAAPGYISNVTPSFVVTNGQLALSDAISISSVELTDSVNDVTAASDVFGNGNYLAYNMGSNQTVGTLPAGTMVADVFITMADGSGIASRTSKLTFVNTGGDAPTWTEYGIIASGSFPATTVSFDSNRNIVVNVAGSETYSVKGVATILK